jgi:RNA polymerase sigma-70 factor (ECF subfamily)
MAGDDAKWFATTRWSLIVAAGDTRSPGGEDALAQLCEVYWPPVYSYVRSRGKSADEARDLTQGFFTRLLEKKYVKTADRERGRFRTFLLTAVKHFMANEWDRERALKRGGGVRPLPMDFDSAETSYGIEPAHEVTPDRLYEKRWALTLLDHVRVRLRGETEARGGLERFERLEPFITGEDDGPGYRQVADDLGMSESAVKVAVHRLRKRFGALLREEVSQTVADSGTVETEIRALFDALQ